ncbi:DUF3859 domain-containing protein [Methylobacterium sp. C25]|uniref:DUF3859 domain-containing protein n=1 Tax=Methylobacterium sp. C25 TaxID=2721622 RepID=UPI001F3156F1|nr:DUF3859 domain-containing protein [Methylobacterium sp. C25]MCE4223224.1 DUF3859 domain-containing protein [Methylobacterium sp. C25]
MRLFPWLPGLVGLLIGGSPARAEVTAEIVDWGVVSGRTDRAISGDGGSGLEAAKPMNGVRYGERTDRIEARLCRSFGMTIRLRSGDSALPRKVEVQALHPLFTRDDGATSRIDAFPSYVLDEGLSHIGFTFEKPWELAEGAWTIRVMARGREIASKAFTITAQVGGAGSECGKGA